MSYVGQTTQSLSRRWSEHCTPSASYCRRLHHALMKYGKDVFIIEPLATATSIEELNTLEEYFIAKEQTISPSGYNLLPGGGNRRHNIETRHKMSQSRQGKPQPWNRGPRGHYSPAHCKAISTAKKGKSNGLLGTKQPGRQVPSTRKKVIALNASGENFEFGSIKEAALKVGGHHSNIVAVLRGRRPRAYGCSWNYL